MNPQPVVYLDVLLSVNLFLNYFLLLMTVKFLGMPYRKWRLLLGALLGAVFSLVILLPTIPFVVILLVKIPMSAAMVAAGCQISSWRSFWKHLACLYAVSFSFAGIMLAISCCFSTSGLVIKNAAVYVAVSPLGLLIVTVICYFAVTLLNRITGRYQLQAAFCTVEVWQGRRKASFLAKIDTGNSLTEPFSGLPVAVVEESVIRPVLPDGFGETVGSGAGAVTGRFRVVTCNTVGGETLLPAFQPERCRIRWGRTVIETTAFYIGVTKRPLNGLYRGLLHPAILSTGEAREEPAEREGSTDSEAKL